MNLVTNTKICDCKKNKGYANPKTKIVRTHGKKSRGYLVCKRCGGLIRK